MPTFADSSCASGKDCNGTISGATFVPGLDNGNALSFDGSSKSEVVFPLALTENILDNEPRSICLWAKFDMVNTPPGGLFNYGHAGYAPAPEDFGFRTRDDPRKFHVQIAFNDPDPFDIDGYDKFAWHHYCTAPRLHTIRPRKVHRMPTGVTYDPDALDGRVKMYFDGAKESAACADINPNHSGQPSSTRVEEAHFKLWYPHRLSNTRDPLATAADAFHLGVYNTDYFTGAIDDLCVYNTTLNGNDVQC